MLPELLSAFLKKQPDCRYLLRRGDSAQIAAAVRSGEIRIGFIGTREELAGLSGVPVAEDRLVMVTPDTDRYRELKRRGVYGRELLGEPTVAREEGSGTDRAVVDYMRYDTVLFDADDTLLDFKTSSDEALAKTLARLGLPFAPGDAQAYDEINLALWRQFERGEIDKDFIYPERFRRFLAPRGLAGRAEEANEFYMR